MEPLRNILPSTTERSFDKPDPFLMAKVRVDSFNSRPGTLNELDGYNCDKCNNRGEFWIVKEENGKPVEYSRLCDCKKTRATIRRMKRSGLGNVIKEKTFERYNATEPWQQAIKAAAVAYAKEPRGWFFVGGQPGSGKSHLGAAICRRFLLSGRAVVYMSWLDDAAQLKSSKGDSGYTSMVAEYKEAEVLYIDDLFKTEERDGVKQPPTGADVRLAFEIVNYRYNNPALLTIVSSEYYAGQLLDIDEAVGSRIIEMAGGNSFNIAKDRSRNYRLKGVTEL